MERFFEGFDLWAITDPICLSLKEWEYIGISAFNSSYFSLDAGQFSGKCLTKGIYQDNAEGFFKRVDNHPHHIIGFDINLISLPTGTRQIFSSYNGVTKFLQVSISASGQIIFSLNGSVIYTHATALTLGQWYYVEIENLVSTSIGKINIWLSDSLVFNLTGDTQGSGTNPYISSYEIFNTTGGAAKVSFDNMYYLESNGSTFRLGPIVIETFRPKATYSENDWTYTGASTAYDALDGLLLSNGPTALTSTMNSEFKLDFSKSLSVNPNIVHDVLIRLQGETEDLGNTNVSASVKADDDVWRYASPLQVNKSSGAYYTFSVPKNPNGNIDWKISEIEYTDFGLKVV
jgi:hypothetical protein